MTMNPHELDLDHLDTLDPKRAEDVGRSIAETLSTDPPSEFTFRLIRATQFLQVEHREVREALSKALFHAARALRDRDLANESQTLWAAIRMAAVFTTTPAALAELADFMHPGGDHKLLQVSLQAIANVSNRGPLTLVPELRELAALVDQTANRFCHFELMTVPAVAALAISAVAAARALALPGVDVWKAEFELRPLLLRQLERCLEELTEDWPEAAKGLEVGRLPPAPRNEAAVREWLSLPEHRQLAALEGDGGPRLLAWINAELEARRAELEATKATSERLWAEFQRHRDKADKDLEEAWDGHQELMEEAPGRGLRRDRKGWVKPAMPRYPRLAIGDEFVKPDGHRLRVTDVGLRTFLAIDLTECERVHPGDPSWLNGPPYAVVEQLWDEYDFPVLEDVVGIHWETHGSGKRLRGLLDAVRIFATHWKHQDGANAEYMDAVVEASEAYWGEIQ